MAGKMRFAAIFVTLSSMLAAGGGAAYFFTQEGKLPFGFGAAPDASLSAESATTAFSAGDLSAIENAWAESGVASAHAAETSRTTAESTTTARSAEGTQPPVEQATDRYAFKSNPGSNAEESPQPIQVQPSVSDAENRYSDDAIQPSSADAVVTEELGNPQDSAHPSSANVQSDSVARGQEPGEVAEIEAIDAEAESNPAAAALRSATNEAGSRAASLHRAREAFRDAAPAAAGSRYDSTRSAPRQLAGSADSPTMVNPFAAPPAAGGSATSEIAPIEAIEPTPEEAGPSPARDDLTSTLEGRSADLGPSPDVANRAIRDAYSGTSSGYGNLRGSGSTAREPNALGGDFGATARSVTRPEGEGTGRPGERALEGPQKPALVIQKLAPPEIQVGKPAKFLVKIQNIGGQTASDVVVHDEVPEGTRLIGTSPSAEVVGSQLTWNIGKLSTGEERTVEIDVQPIAEGEIGSVATVTYSAQASAKTRCTMPQLAIRMTAPAEVMIGQEQRVKIELHNPGSGDATGVMIFENVPENLRHEAGSALEFEIGTLKAGETRELELVLIAEKAGKVDNVLSARADGNLQVQQQVEFEVIAPALSVAVDGPGRRYLERAATYQVIVENPGTAPARDVELVTKLPKGMRFVRANNLGEYDASSHAVYWSLAELPEGERGTVELVAMPIETGTQTLEVEGRAQQGLSDQTEQEIMIEGIASIMFEVRDADDPIEVGGETSYEIRVANEGTKSATNVRVAVNMTPGMKLVSAEGESQHSAQGSAILFAPLAQLAPKTDTLYRVKVKGTEPGDQRINVQVSSDDLSQPIRREESTRVFGDE